MATRQIGTARLEVIVADITTLSVDAIVNAANALLLVAWMVRSTARPDPNCWTSAAGSMAAKPAVPKSPEVIGCRRDM